MSDSARQRLQAVGSHLSATPSDTFEGIPTVKRIAEESNGPRAKDKVVIITGANSPLGIGRATAHQYAQNGAKAIYICDFVDEHLETHKREINALYPGADVHPRKFDGADEAAVKGVIEEAVAQYGRLDVFFANAGIVGDFVAVTDVDADDFMNVFRVNTLGPFLAIKHAIPAMKKTSAAKPEPTGSLILTASVAGLRANAGPTAYSASKAAVVSLAQTTAFQLAGTKIRANALCPGVIETGMTAPMYEMARARGTTQKIGQLNPLKRGAHADEVARVALFLGSDESSYVNGQAWAVDGGLSAGHPYVPGKMS